MSSDAGKNGRGACVGTAAAGVLASPPKAANSEGRDHMRTLLASLGASFICLLAFAFAPVAADELTCQGEPATIVASGSGTTVGTVGPDVIVGTTGADTIFAGDGDDLVCGAPDGATTDGGDTIDGGSGNDNLVGGFGNDTIDGGSGD